MSTIELNGYAYRLRGTRDDQAVVMVYPIPRIDERAAVDAAVSVTGAIITMPLAVWRQLEEMDRVRLRIKAISDELVRSNPNAPHAAIVSAHDQLAELIEALKGRS